MTYSCVCPFPCLHEIRVDATNDEDAVTKLLKAGVLRCRNNAYRCQCEKAQEDMAPISEEKLKQIVSACMREEENRPEDYHDILAPLYSKFLATNGDRMGENPGNQKNS